MPSELYFQKQLINAAVEMDGYGQKLSNRFIVGVPDLLLQVPGWRTTLVEAKQHFFVPNPKIIHIDLTKIQEDRLKRHTRSGGDAGWAMVAHSKDGQKWVMASRNLSILTFDANEYKANSCHMQRNEPWTKALKYLLRQISGLR